MKKSKIIWLVAVTLSFLSSCYVQVDKGHRHMRHHHDHEVVIEHR